MFGFHQQIQNTNKLCRLVFMTNSFGNNLSIVKFWRYHKNFFNFLGIFDLRVFIKMNKYYHCVRKMYALSRIFISCRSVLLVLETRESRENRRPEASHWQTHTLEGLLRYICIRLPSIYFLLHLEKGSNFFTCIWYSVVWQMRNN
jgi:hypothetical protein